MSLYQCVVGKNLTGLWVCLCVRWIGEYVNFSEYISCVCLSVFLSVMFDHGIESVVSTGIHQREKIK